MDLIFWEAHLEKHAHVLKVISSLVILVHVCCWSHAYEHYHHLKRFVWFQLSGVPRGGHNTMFCRSPLASRDICCSESWLCSISCKWLWRPVYYTALYTVFHPSRMPLFQMLEAFWLLHKDGTGGWHALQGMVPRTIYYPISALATPLLGSNNERGLVSESYYLHPRGTMLANEGNRMLD